MIDSYTLPEAIEPDYWNVVFYPSDGAWRALGRFKHVSAFTYVPGFRAWLICDVQWSGMRLCVFSHAAAMRLFTHYTEDCTIVKFTRQHRQMMLASRLGFPPQLLVICLRVYYGATYSLELRLQLGVAYHHSTSAVFQHVMESFERIGRIHRHICPPGLHHPEHTLYHAEASPQTNTDALLLSYSRPS